MTKTKVVIVDDHEIFISGLKFKLQSWSHEIECIGSACNYWELMELLQKGPLPDVLVLDCNLPDINGIQITSEIKNNEKFKKIRILMLSAFKSSVFNAPDYDLIIDALDAGVSGYILKDSAVEDIVHGILSVKGTSTIVLGETIDMAQLNKTILQDRKRLRSLLKKESKFGLTPREVEVLQALASGKSAKEAATALGVTEEAITTHKDNIKFKLKSRYNIDLKNVVEMIVWAIRSKVITI